MSLWSWNYKPANLFVLVLCQYDRLLISWKFLSTERWPIVIILFHVQCVLDGCGVIISFRWCNGVSHLMFATRYNVRYGRSTATDEEVENATRTADIHDRILTFPDGMPLTWYHPLYKWCTVASGTFKYVVLRLTCHHSGYALVMTFQPKDNIFECSTSNRASFVLMYDQLRASTKSGLIIYLRFCFTQKPKSKFPMCNCYKFGYRITTVLVHIVSGYFWVFAFDQFSFLFLF